MYTIMFKAKVGDRATLCTYAPCSEAELLGFKPRMLHMAPGNEQSLTSPAIADQAASRFPLFLPIESPNPDQAGPLSTK